jgi:hypothetical protein
VTGLSQTVVLGSPRVLEFKSTLMTAHTLSTCQTKSANILGTLSCNSEIPDSEAFTANLAINSPLNDAITTVHVQQQAHLKSNTQARAEYLVREARRQSKKLMTSKEKEMANQKKENYVETQARLEEQRKKERKLVVLVKEKRATGCKKWTAEEASVLGRYFGIKVPV